MKRSNSKIVIKVICFSIMTFLCMACEKKQSKKGISVKCFKWGSLKGMINTAWACKWEDILGM